MRSLPTGWVDVTLGDIAGNAQYGWTTKASESGTVKFLRTTDITKGTIDWASVPYCDEPPRDLEKYKLRKNDIVISRAGSVGFSKLVDDVAVDAVFASYLIRFSPTKRVEPRYLFHFLRSEEYWQQIRAASAGVALANVNAKKLSAIRVPLAPLSEQKRIADKLDRLLAAVDTCKARLDAIPTILKRFRQSVLAAATSGELTGEWRIANTAPRAWDRVRVSELCEIQNGRAFPSVDYMAKGVRLLRPGNLAQSGAVEWNEGNTVCLPPSFAQEYPEFLLGAGELLMNLTAQSLKDEFLGRVCLKIDATPALLNQRIARLLPNTKYDVRPWLFLFFRSPKFRAFVDSLDSGTLIRHMHSKQVRDYEVELPGVDEQREIWNRVDSLFTTIGTLAAKLHIAKARVDKLPQSLLAKAFRGELVGQDSTRELALKLSVCNHDSRADESIGVAGQDVARRRKRA